MRVQLCACGCTFPLVPFWGLWLQKCVGRTGRAGEQGQRIGHAAPDALWPPCLVIYLQLNSGDGRGQVFHLDKKKRALLKGTDLSITLFCRHGAFIAFLSTSPFPFLNHSHSPPPLSLSSQETRWFLFIFTDTCPAALVPGNPVSFWQKLQ